MTSENATPESRARSGVVAEVAQQYDVRPEDLVDPKFGEYSLRVLQARLALVERLQRGGVPAKPVISLSIATTLRRSGNELDQKRRAHRIIRAVAESFEVQVSELTKRKDRSGDLGRAQQILMYLLRTMTALSLAEIGKICGGRDHTTVFAAVRVAEEKLERDSSFASSIDALKASIPEPGAEPISGPEEE